MGLDIAAYEGLTKNDSLKFVDGDVFNQQHEIVDIPDNALIAFINPAFPDRARDMKIAASTMLSTASALKQGLIAATTDGGRCLRSLPVIRKPAFKSTAQNNLSMPLARGSPRPARFGS